MSSTLQKLSAWFASNCDGDWEHGSGVRITTLDNPGWCLEVDLSGTPLEDRPFTLVEDGKDHDKGWLRCWTEKSTFHAACGPLRLEDALGVFLDWAEPG
jgi:hypothetical protein